MDLPDRAYVTTVEFSLLGFRGIEEKGIEVYIVEFTIAWMIENCIKPLKNCASTSTTLTFRWAQAL